MRRSLLIISSTLFLIAILALAIYAHYSKVSGIAVSDIRTSTQESNNADEHTIDPVTATDGDITFQITGTTTGYADNQTETNLLTVYQAGKVVIMQPSGTDLDELYIVGKGCPWMNGSCDPNSSPTFGVDITGNGGKDFIVNDVSPSGDSSLDNYYIYELPKDGGVIKQIAVLNIDGGAAFKKLASGKFIVELGDDTFRFWNADDVHSPWPQVILSYQDGQFAPDLSFMHASVPALSTLTQKATPWTADEWSNGACPSEDTCSMPWGYALDLIYSGNAQSAKTYLDLAWKPSKAFSSEQDFINQFTAQLKQSPYYSSILSLNGGNRF
jgi:hypothetical protein